MECSPGPLPLCTHIPAQGLSQAPQGCPVTQGRPGPEMVGRSWAQEPGLPPPSWESQGIVALCTKSQKTASQRVRAVLHPGLCSRTGGSDCVRLTKVLAPVQRPDT